MANSLQPKSWRDVLPIHPAAELFPLMSESAKAKLEKPKPTPAGAAFDDEIPEWRG